VAPQPPRDVSRKSQLFGRNFSIWTAPDNEEDVAADLLPPSPPLFAVEMGLARLWQSWGLEPGRSVAGSQRRSSISGRPVSRGVFSLEDGMLLMVERRVGCSAVCLRGGADGRGFSPDAERVERLTDEFPSVSVAAYNGANTVFVWSRTGFGAGGGPGLTADGCPV